MKSQIASASTESVIYAAGFFDGEGSISIVIERAARRRVTPCYRMFTQLVNTDEHVMRWLAATFGGKLVFESSKRKGIGKNGRHHSSSWRWRLASVQAGMFLQRMLPYLRVKHAQAEIALAFQSHISSYEFRIHRVGKRGCAPLPPEVIELRANLAHSLSECRNSQKQTH